MRVVLELEVRELFERDPEAARQKLQEHEWVMDQNGTFIPSEEFWRILQNSGSVNKNQEREHEVVGA